MLILRSVAWQIRIYTVEAYKQYKDICYQFLLIDENSVILLNDIIAKYDIIPKIYVTLFMDMSLLELVDKSAELFLDSKRCIFSPEVAKFRKIIMIEKLCYTHHEQYLDELSNMDPEILRKIYGFDIRAKCCAHIRQWAGYPGFRISLDKSFVLDGDLRGLYIEHLSTRKVEHTGELLNQVSGIRRLGIYGRDCHFIKEHFDVTELVIYCNTPDNPIDGWCISKNENIKHIKCFVDLQNYSQDNTTLVSFQGYARNEYIANIADRNAANIYQSRFARTKPCFN